MRIYYNKLNKEVKKNIKEKRYSRTELKEVYDALKKTQELRSRTFRKVMVMVIAIIAALNLMMIPANLPPQLLLFTLSVTLVCGVGALIVCWVLMFGILKIQFNTVVDKAYPENMGEYHL